MSDPITISLTISDPVLIAGVEYARDLYNAALPEVQATNDDGTPKTDANGAPVYVSPKPGALDSAGYVTHVGAMAVRSYAAQKAEADFQAGLITKIERDARIAAISQ